jgi:hypothetical protein
MGQSISRRGLFSVSNEPQTSKTGLRYDGPVSVRHREFINHETKSSVVSRQLSVQKPLAISGQLAAHIGQGSGTAGFLLNTDN